MSGVISTNPARCRDCYRCVRTCPVKAVRVSGGQAEVVEELCIACASCVRACPQRAKVVRDDLPIVRAVLASGRKVIASVAPSAPAFFDMNSFESMERALFALGFAGAGETAMAAEMTGRAHGALINEAPERWPIIASACPVVVDLIEKYYPDLIPHLAPIVSPMIAHGRYLRARYGPDALIVFIGPCIAKKAELREPEVAGAVDAALSFDELARWMDEAGVVFGTDTGKPESQGAGGLRGEGAAGGLAGNAAPGAGGGLQSISSTPWPSFSPASQPAGSPARMFPIEGGLVGTARLDTDHLSSHVVTGTGMTTCVNVLEGVRSGRLGACMVELMACDGGCINGPAFMQHASVALSRQRVMAYAARRGPLSVPPQEEWPLLERSYTDRSIPVPDYTEEQIREALRSVDKYRPEDELNCGSCGYSSCREKAIATLRGMAERTMCIPYMRARAESLNAVVMDATPNAIIIVDRDLRIQDLSHSAAQLFNCSRAASRGQALRDVVPIVDDFLAVCNGRSVLNKIVRIPASPDRERGELLVEASIVPVQGDKLMVAVLHDVTERERARVELERIRAEAIKRSQEVINKQMRVAHEIAGLLGETTAETKILLRQLTRLMEDSDSKDRKQ